MEEVVPGTEDLVPDPRVCEPDEDAGLHGADVRPGSRGRLGGGNLAVLDARARSVAGMFGTGMGHALRRGTVSGLVPDAVIALGPLVAGNGIVVGTLGSTVCANSRRPHEDDGEKQSSPSTGGRSLTTHGTLLEGIRRWCTG